MQVSIADFASSKESSFAPPDFSSMVRRRIGWAKWAPKPVAIESLSNLPPSKSTHPRNLECLRHHFHLLFFAIYAGDDVGIP